MRTNLKIGAQVIESSAAMIRRRRVVTAIQWLMISCACVVAADRSGADCLNSGIAQLGSGEVTKLTITCNTPEPMVLIGIPATSVPVEPRPGQVPKEVAALIKSMRSQGSNWCAIPQDELATLPDRDTGNLRFECRRLFGNFKQYEVVRGSTFLVDVVKAEAGVIEVVGLRAKE